MFSAVKKIMICCAVGTVIVSCGNSQEEKAREYLTTAKEQFEKQDYLGALATLDSLDKNYAEEIDARREGIVLRPAIMEQQIQRQLVGTDSLIEALVNETRPMNEKLQFVEDAFEGYYTTKALAGKIPAQQSGLYSRVTKDGVLSVISSSTRKAGSTGVTISAGGQSASTPSVANDGERNDRSRGVEIITYMPDECVAIGEFAMSHVDEPLTLTFDGDNPYSIKLPVEQAEALALIYKASKLYADLAKAHLQKKRLEKQLETARAQIARNGKAVGTDIQSKE